MIGGRAPGVRAGGGGVVVCPHCWQVNRYSERLCARCGGDMTLLLQESGGLRATAPVQSPVPVGVRERLGPVQRVMVLGCAVLLVLAMLVGAVAPWGSGRRPAAVVVPGGRSVGAPQGRAGGAGREAGRVSPPFAPWPRARARSG